MCSGLPFGLGHQVAILLITTTVLPFPAFSQHMITLEQPKRGGSFYFLLSRQEEPAGWRYLLVNGARFLSVDGLLV